MHPDIIIPRGIENRVAIDMVVMHMQRTLFQKSKEHQEELARLGKEVEDLAQRTILFRTACKTKYSVCKVIVDSGSTYNLVSTKMVEKLELETTDNPSPYKVSWLHKGH